MVMTHTQIIIIIKVTPGPGVIFHRCDHELIYCEGTDTPKGARGLLALPL